VLDHVNSTNFWYANASSSSEGALVVQHWDPQHGPLTWHDRHGKVIGIAVDDLVANVSALSPDGTRVAYGNLDPQDLYVRDLATGVATRLTFHNQSVTSIVWSWDGQTIGYSRLSQAHGWEVYTQAATGGGPDSILFHGPGLVSYLNDWSRDGRWAVGVCYDSTGQADLWRVPTQGGGRPEVYQRTPEVESSASLSPDGHWLAYVAQEGAKRSVFVQSFPDPGTKYQVSAEDVVGVAWSRRGDALFVGSASGELRTISVGS